MVEQTLNGLSVLVTRPRDQNKEMLALLRAAGAQADAFPVIEIRDLTAHMARQLNRDRIVNSDLLIFVSQNAVKYALRLFVKIGIDLSSLPIAAAVGKSTAELLEQHKIKVFAFPQNPGSENLLRMANITEVAKQGRVTIFRGVGGKETLARELRKIATQVFYLELYERVCPKAPPLKIRKDKTNYDLTMVTSIDALQNLYKLAANKSLLLKQKLLLGSANTLATCRAIGFRKEPLLANSPLDLDMLRAAQKWWQNRSRNNK